MAPGFLKPRPLTSRLSAARPGLLRRMFHPGWRDLADVVNGEGRGALGRSEALAWALVLESRRVPHRMRQTAGAFDIQVPSWCLDRAAEEIRLYLAENPHTMEARLGLRQPAQAGPTLAAMLVLLLAHAAQGRAWPGLGRYPGQWLEQGSAKAGLILAGQWWRTVTALTLHADAAHVLANAVIGGIFISLVCRDVGSGLGWLLVLAAGAAGNAANAWVQPMAHDSLGFSTAVFGAAGLLSGLRAAEGRLSDLRGGLPPVAAGLGLLAMLGSSGENTDLAAHLFGFVAGVVLGGLAGAALARLGRPGRRLSILLGAIAAALPCLAWLLAFGRG